MRNAHRDGKFLLLIQEALPVVNWEKADEAPSLPGAYVIAIELAKTVAVTVAGRSPITLPAGRYLYCGSAKGPGGLKARLSRHLRRGKAVRWHVDQLTEQGLIVGRWIIPGGDECELVRKLSHLPMPIARFGSSDCTKCRSHLLHWPNGTVLPLLDAGISARRGERVVRGYRQVTGQEPMPPETGLMRHENSPVED